MEGWDGGRSAHQFSQLGSVAQLWILAGERGKARGSGSRAHLVLVLEQAVHQVTVVDAHGALLLEGSLHGDLCELPWVVRSRIAIRVPSRGITRRRRNSSKSAALEIRAVMEDGGPFSIAEWAAQATPAPKVEPKDDPRVEGRVDRPHRRRRLAEARRVDRDGGRTGRRRGDDAGRVGAARRPVDRGRDLRGDARADRDAFGGRRPRRPRQVRQAVRPRARPTQNSERFASARRAASRADKVRHPTPVSGDAWGAKLPVMNPADGVVVPGAFEGESLRPGSDAGRDSCVHRRDETEGRPERVRRGGHRGRVTPGWFRTRARDGRGGRRLDRPTSNRDQPARQRRRPSRRAVLAPTAVRARRRVGVDEIASLRPGPGTIGEPLPERARAMIPLVRAMLPGNAMTDASILTARASDDHRRQAQVVARMEKSNGNRRIRKGEGSQRGDPGVSPSEGDGAEGAGGVVGAGRGWRSLGMSRATGGRIGSGGARGMTRREVASRAEGWAAGMRTAPSPSSTWRLSDGENGDAEDDDGDGDELGDEDEDEDDDDDDFIDDEEDRATLTTGRRGR